MASIIKSQILKHLSKFTKNLSPDKIHLSTLKGEGEMSNLELDEVVLMELLDLPTWLRLTGATCNKVAIKIQWTRLKAQPICLYLDEIVVDMETCDIPRQPCNVSNLSSYSAGSAAPPPDAAASTGGKYGFAERIIDGMFVSINSVVVNFKAPTFQASIQISRIIVQSKTPLWQLADLRLTRVKDELRGEILIFKEAEWQTLRIEANALDASDPALATTPLRLIANQSKTRITIKKRLADCGMVASRVQFNLDDLLWVLTDSQLKAAIVFANSLKEVIQKSSHQAKLRATEKLKAQGPSIANQAVRQQQHQQQQQQQQQQRTGTKSQNAMAKLFSKYEVVETSYHLYTGRVDLHLCDDMAPEAGSRRKVEGGAMQITIHKLSLDHYPFHPAGGDRGHWLKHDENMAARFAWAQDLLNVFREDVRRVRETLSTPPPSPGGGAAPGGGGRGAGPGGGGGGGGRTQAGYRGLRPSAGGGGGGGSGGGGMLPPQPRINTKLMESGLVMRIEDFALYRVSTAKDNKRNSPKKFVASDKRQLLLPPEMSSIHVEYTDYYFPEGINFPVPHANLFVVVNPVRLTVDWMTLLWLNAFSLDLLQSLELPEADGPRIHTDIKIDALMPRVILPAEAPPRGQPDRPDSLQVQASRLTFTNCHLEQRTSLADLGALLRTYEASPLFAAARADFPRRDEDFLPLPSLFRRHVQKENDVYLDQAFGDIVLGRRVAPPERALAAAVRSEGGVTYFSMSTDSLKLDATKDVWCLTVDQFWLEFLGVPSAHGRPVPFVESFPLTLWLATPLASESSARAAAARGAGDRNSPRVLERSGSASLLKQYYSNDGTAVGAAAAAAAAGERGSPSPPPLLPQQGYMNGDVGGAPVAPAPRPRRALPERPCADTHLLVQVGQRVSLQLNHYQYVFLMRLIETLTKFSAELKEDTAAILRLRAGQQQQAPPPPAPLAAGEKSLVLAVKLRELEVALICPPVPEMPASSAAAGGGSGSGGGMGTTSREDSDELKMLDDLPEDAARMMAAARDVADDSALGGSINSEGRSHGLQTPAPLLKSHSDTELTGPEPVFATHAQPVVFDGVPHGLSETPSRGHQWNPAAADVSSLFPRIQISDGSTTAHEMNSGGGGYSSSSSPQHRGRALSSESLHYDPATERERKGGEIRKSFNNAFSNLSRLTEKVKQNVKALDVREDADDWDSLSLRSGASSDDEDFVLLKLENATEVPAFEAHHSSSESVSVADSDGRDESASVSGGFGGMADRARGVVSVVSFKLANTEAIVQMRGDNMSVSAQVHHVTPHEYGNINLDKFHQRFNAASRETEEKLPPPVAEPPVRLRYQVGPAAESLAQTAGELGHLRTVLAGLRLKLYMSSVTNLVDLIEDEVIPPPMPLNISVTDCTFTLQNDAPPTHMTSPEPVPLDFHIDRLALTRANDGVFRVSTALNRELEGLTAYEKHKMATAAPPGVRPYDGRPGTPPGVKTYDQRPSTPPGVRGHDQRPGTPPVGRTHDQRPGTPPAVRSHDQRPGTPPSVRNYDQRPGTPPGGGVGRSQDSQALREALRQMQSQSASLERVKRENTALRERIVQVEEELESRPAQQEMHTALQEENNMLRRQLEKIATTMDGRVMYPLHHPHPQGSPQHQDVADSMQRQLDHWRDQAGMAEAVQRENAQLISDLTHQQEEIHSLKQERESLLATLQLLQEELTTSETMRQTRGKPAYS